MTEPRDQRLPSVRRWLEHADEDLDVAGRALQPPTLAKSACGSAHLAVEKALKGYLIWLGLRRVPRTHNLAELVVEAQKIGAGDLPGDDLRLLNRYSPTLRYPDRAAPSHEEAHAAVRSAEQVVQTLRALMDM